MAINAVPSEGVRTLPLSQIKATFPVLSNPANRHRAVRFASELQATWVDHGKDDRAPLLGIAGDEDHVMPAAVNESNAKKHRRSKAVTAYKEFAGRSHDTLGQEGSEEVADYALNWALEHAADRPRPPSR